MNKKIKFIFIFLSSLIFIYPQHPINGLLEYNKYSTQPNFTKLYKYDFNKDGKSDLLLIGKPDKKAVWHILRPDEKITDIINKFFFYPITNMEKFNLIKGTGETHLFASRKERIIGLVSITEYGTIQLLNELSFDFYPDGIRTGDFNRDGKMDAILFGSSFQGISLIEEEAYRLKENKILDEGVFSELTLIDFNTDGYKDFVAFNPLDNSFHFFENIDSANFQEIRELKWDKNIINLSTIYFNNDPYVDLVFSSGNNLNIFYGDSVFSFSNRRKINLSSDIKKFTNGDFNGDDKNDFAVISNSGLYLILSSDFDSFSTQLFIDNSKGAEDLISSGFNSFFVYRKNGELENYKYSKKIEAKQNYKFSETCSYLSIEKINNSKFLSFIDSVNSEFILIKDFETNKSLVKKIKIQNPVISRIYSSSNENSINYTLVSKDLLSAENIFFDLDDFSYTKLNLVFSNPNRGISSTSKELVFSSRSDSNIVIKKYEFYNDDITEDQEIIEADSSKTFLFNGSDIYSISDDKFELTSVTTEEKISIPNFRLVNKIQLDKNYSILIGEAKSYILSGVKIFLLPKSFNLLEKKTIGLVDNFVTGIDVKNSMLYQFEIKKGKIKTRFSSITLDKKINISDFQLTETLIIFSTEDGTITTQELEWKN